MTRKLTIKVEGSKSHIGQNLIAREIAIHLSSQLPGVDVVCNYDSEMNALFTSHEVPRLLGHPICNILDGIEIDSRSHTSIDIAVSLDPNDNDPAGTVTFVTHEAVSTAIDKSKNDNEIRIEISSDKVMAGKTTAAVIVANALKAAFPDTAVIVEDPEGCYLAKAASATFVHANTIRIVDNPRLLNGPTLPGHRTIVIETETSTLLEFPESVTDQFPDAMELLIHAYARGEINGATDWSDVDAAFRRACQDKPNLYELTVERLKEEQVKPDDAIALLLKADARGELTGWVDQGDINEAVAMARIERPGYYESALRALRAQETDPALAIILDKIDSETDAQESAITIDKKAGATFASLNHLAGDGFEEIDHEHGLYRLLTPDALQSIVDHAWDSQRRGLPGPELLKVNVNDILLPTEFNECAIHISIEKREEDQAFQQRVNVLSHF